MCILLRTVNHTYGGVWMTVSERRRAIMEILQDKGFVKITDISSAFDVSNETARRDLDFLQGQQLIHRTHGGAIPVTAENRQKSTKIPLSSGDNVVRALAAATSKLIKPGETIYLGNGSTMREVARCLKDRDNLIVVSNSLHVINELVDSNVTVFVIGGYLSRDEHDITGDLMVDCLNRFYCDKAIFSCGGVSMDLGVMDYSSSGTRTQMPAIRRSAQHILVASSHKFGLYAFLSACSLDDIDIIVSDSNLSEEFRVAIRKRGIKLILVEPEQFEDFPES